MDYWADTMQDDCYLIAADGWEDGAQPREIVQVKNKDNKLVWPETEDFKRGKRRFKSDLIPAAILIDRYFPAERDASLRWKPNSPLSSRDSTRCARSKAERRACSPKSLEGEGDKQKITAKSVKARLKEIGKDPDYADERQALEGLRDSP